MLEELIMSSLKFCSSSALEREGKESESSRLFNGAKLREMPSPKNVLGAAHSSPVGWNDVY